MSCVSLCVFCDVRPARRAPYRSASVWRGRGASLVLWYIIPVRIGPRPAPVVPRVARRRLRRRRCLLSEPPPVSRPRLVNRFSFRLCCPPWSLLSSPAPALSSPAPLWRRPLVLCVAGVARPAAAADRRPRVASAASLACVAGVSLVRRIARRIRLSPTAPPPRHSSVTSPIRSPLPHRHQLQSLWFSPPPPPRPPPGPRTSCSSPVVCVCIWLCAVCAAAPRRAARVSVVALASLASSACAVVVSRRRVALRRIRSVFVAREPLSLTAAAHPQFVSAPVLPSAPCPSVSRCVPLNCVHVDPSPSPVSSSSLAQSVRSLARSSLVSSPRPPRGALLDLPPLSALPISQLAARLVVAVIECPSVRVAVCRGPTLCVVSLCCFVTRGSSPSAVSPRSFLQAAPCAAVRRCVDEDRFLRRRRIAALAPPPRICVVSSVSPCRVRELRRRVPVAVAVYVVFFPSASRGPSAALCLFLCLANR